MADAVGAGRGNLEQLFATTYLAERSVYAAKRSAGGLPPTLDRVLFLQRLVRQLAESARVLVIYGNTYHGAWQENEAYAGMWEWTNREISKSFLDVECLDEPAVAEGMPGSDAHRIAVFDSGSRRVIWCRALSGANVNDEYVAVARSLASGTR